MSRLLFTLVLFFGSCLFATHREEQFENEYVQVWKTEISPHDVLTVREPKWPRVIVPLSSGVMKLIDCGTEKATHYNFEVGKSYWLDAVSHEAGYEVKNESENPLVMIVIKILR